MNIAVVGLGKLGLPMAVLYASRGYEVLGIDNNATFVEKLRNGICPIQETGLSELLATVKDKLSFSTEYEGIDDYDIVFIIVPTPSNPDGRFANDYVMSAIQNIGERIKGMNQPPLLVVTSTVMPGTIDDVVSPELKRITGKDISICYNPEFIALGSVIKDMENPDVILIGESEEEAGNLLYEFYCRFHNYSLPSICRMSLWNAEVAKLMLNVFVTTKISLANTFAQICDNIPFGDIDVVLRFLGLDKRIGSKYLKGGLGFGGTCFPRDNRAFISMAERLGIECPLETATDKFNHEHDRYVSRRILTLINGGDVKGKVVSILGVTYKPDTCVVEESSALTIAKCLRNLGVTVKAYDPMGKDNAELICGEGIVYCETIEECLNQSQLCVIAVPWKEFASITSQTFKSCMKHPAIYDCWRIMDKNALSDVEYHALGINDG